MCTTLYRQEHVRKDSGAAMLVETKVNERLGRVLVHLFRGRVLVKRLPRDNV